MTGGTIREFSDELSAELGEQVLGVDGLGEDLEFVALEARAFQQVGGGGLA